MTDPGPRPRIGTHEPGRGGALTDRDPTSRRRDRSEPGIDADEPPSAEPGDEAPDLLERVAEVVGDLFDDETDADA